MSAAGARLLFGGIWILLLAGVAWWEGVSGDWVGSAAITGLLWVLSVWEYNRMLFAPPAQAASASPGLRALLLLFGVPYLLCLWSLIALRLWFGEAGFALAFLVVGITKGGDMGAYFIGTRFGRTKLAPVISPKKTIEGAIGGLAMSALVALLAAIGSDRLGLSRSQALLFGAIVGVCGQAGDLVESWIKRQAGIKDSGNWPGLGGALDMVDSLLLAAPAACWLYPVLTR